MPGSVYWKDRQGVYLGCNAQLAKILGLASPDTIIGKTDKDLIGTAMAKPIEQIDHAIMQGNQPYTFEETGFDVDLKPATYLTTKIPLHDDNENVIGLVGISQDITERKKAEEILKAAQKESEAANTIKTAFIENMQHDLRTPAYGVCCALAELMQTECQPERKQLLTQAYKSAKQLFGLCMEVTDFDKIERHEKAVVNKKFDLHKLIQQVVDLNQTAAKQKHLQFSHTIDEKVTTIVKSDDYRIKRILMNLIGNAIKFTHQGKITLTVYALKKTKRKIIIRFQVTDTGIGIAQEKKDFIYEKFSRGTPANTSNYQGIGLGLRLVKQFVEDLSGDLEVHSELNQGTTFHVTLPLEIPLSNDFPETVEIVKPASRTAKKLSKTTLPQMPLSILLIEDEPLAQMAAEKALRAFGCTITTANTAQQARGCLQQTTFDLIFSDIGLPDGSGFELANYVKNNPALPNYHTPIFALTAHSGQDKQQQAAQAGFSDLLTKPLTLTKLQQVLEQQNQPKANDIINWEFSKRYGYTEQECLELTATLCAELPDCIQLMRNARLNNDLRALRELLHKLRGGFCYVGVLQLQQAATDLHEMIKKSPSLDAIDSLFEMFYTQAEKVLTEYQRIIHQNESKIAHPLKESTLSPTE